MMKPASPMHEKSAISAKVWWFAGLLLLASAINYMDRQTLANAAVRISHEFNMSQEQYGNLEAGFGLAFAVGSLFFGFLADRVSVRWLYAGVVLLWSATGFLSGTVENYHQLLICRTLLGFFEAGHWPCGIKTVCALLDAKGRAMGNSVLQSGTSIGAIVTPLIMSVLLTKNVSSWRLPFRVIGVIGLFWVICWVFTGPREVLAKDVSSEPKDSDPWWKVLLDRRMLVILVVVSLINTTWQLLRAWLPKFLEEGRGYAEQTTLYYNSLWFVATDIGCIGAALLRCGFPGGDSPLSGQGC